MADKIAIDVVLLPPDEIMDIAIDLNRRFEPAFELDKHVRLPHITLLQCIVSRSDLDTISQRLQATALHFKPIKLKGTTDVHPGAFLSAEVTSDFVFKNEGSVHELHVEIITSLKDIATFDAKDDYFFDQNVREKSIYWVKNFVENASFDKFHPHITLGTTKPVEPPVNVDFKASRLAVCHLGDYSTCRQILFEVNLAA